MTDQLSLLDLRRELRALDRLDLEVEDFDAIRERYRSLLNGVQVVVGRTSGAELFFRGRKNPAKKPIHVSELGAPPKESVAGFQRCNAPGNPMLYVSSKRITALKECRLKPGDLVYLSQWMGNDRVSVNKLLDEEEDSVFLESLNEYNHIFHSHIESLFSRRIHEDYSSDYKLSAAVTEILTSNFPPDEHTGDGGSIGFRYPSVFDKKGSYNTAFPAAAFEDKLRVNHVIELLMGQPDGSPMPVRVLDTAFSFPDGRIIWTGNAHFLPLPRDKGSVLFRSDGQRWNVAVREQEANEADVRALLLE